MITKMDKILFVNISEKILINSCCEIPLGLGYVYTSAIRHGFDAYFFDMQIKSYDELKYRIQNEGITILGFSVNSYQFPMAKKIITEIKKIFPKVMIICGGVHATFAEEELLQIGVDKIMKGPGDKSIISVLQDCCNHEKSLKQRVYEQEVNIEFCDIDYNLIPDINAYTSFSICYSRGCKGNCLFCSSHKFWKGKVVHHSEEWLNEKLENAYSLGFKDIKIIDDAFLNKNLCSKNVIEMLYDKHKRFGMTYSVNARITDIEIDRLEDFYNAGIRAVVFGIEGFINNKFYNYKTGTKEKTAMVVKACQDAGFYVRTSWILGLPEFGNNYSCYSSFADDIIYVNADDVGLHWLIPFPGCYYAIKKELFNFNCNTSYNDVPYGLYNYLSNNDIKLISSNIEERLIYAGYSNLKSAKKHYYLPD